MIKSLLPIFGLYLIFLTSCKKEDKQPDPIDPETPNYTTPSTVGSYWVYEDFVVDSTGNITSTGQIDSVYLLGDSIINGKSYFMYGNTAGSFPQLKFERDSSGYIVNESGYILYSYSNLGNIYHSFTSTGFPGPNGPINLIVEYSMLSAQQNINVPAGNFNTYVSQQNCYDEAGGPVNECGDAEFKLKSYYASGVGKIHEEYAYFGAMTVQCSYHYRALIDYYIAP